MRSTNTQPATPDRSRAAGVRRATSKALAWIGLAAIAAFPFPWWW